jgi:hypothetical protein
MLKHEEHSRQAQSACSNAKAKDEYQQCLHHKMNKDQMTSTQDVSVRLAGGSNDQNDTCTRPRCKERKVESSAIRMICKYDEMTSAHITGSNDKCTKA